MKNPQIYAARDSILRIAQEKEIKEMLVADYNESVTPQASVYRWYSDFKSDRSRAELMHRSAAPKPPRV